MDPNEISPSGISDPGLWAEQQTKPKSQTQPKPKPKPKPQKSLVDQAVDIGRNVLEGGLAIPAGVVDAAVNLVNALPQVSGANVGLSDYELNQLTPSGPKKPLPQIPKFKNPIFQVARNFSASIAPEVIGTIATSGMSLGPAAVRIAGITAADSGFSALGTAIDPEVKSQKNLARLTKDYLPILGNWIPNDWATLDTDSPDKWKEKNVKESAILGMIPGLIEGLHWLAKGKKGATAAEQVARAVTPIPLDEKAAQFARQAQDDIPLVDPLTKTELDRTKALDDLGSYRELKYGDDLSVSAVGLTDDYDAIEQGIRSIDDYGVVGAQLDAARIQNNINTQYGRLRNFLSEGALKYGLKAENATKRTIVKAVQDAIESSGKFDFLVGNKILKRAQIDEASDVLAKEWYDARLDVDQMKEALAPFQFKNEYNVKQLNSVATAGVTKLMRQYLDDYVSLDSIRAAGLVATQKAGQLSDTAEAMRLVDGTEAILRGQEQILDIMEYLMVEKGISSYMRGYQLNALNIWRTVKNGFDKGKIEAEFLDEHEKFMSSVVEKAKTTADGLREISKEHPEFLTPLQMAWEFSDGNIDTLDKLHKFYQESLPKIQKAVFDGEPQVPNLILRGAWANVMNSTLSAIATTGKAFWSNAALGLAKPVSIFAGAALRGDIKTAKRAWFMYSAYHQSLSKGLTHMRQVFNKAWKDPQSVEYIVRSDIADYNEAQFDVLHSYAMAQQQLGNDGPMALYTIAKALDDMANHPLLRIGSNALTATDGFTRAVLAHGEARFKLFDRFVDSGEELTGKQLRELEDELYNQMFDKNGLITDEAIKFASNEISMNLDNAGSQALSSLLSKLPFMKPFMMFPKTSTNLITIQDKFSPLSLFMQDYNELAYKASREFTDADIEEILTKRGIPVDELARERFDMLRAEALGRKAIGTTLLLSAAFMFMNDRITGDGLYDPKRQKARESLRVPKRSFMGLDGKWHSYDNLGPISDWLAVVVTTMDNFDTLDPADLGIFYNKATFVLGTALTGKSPLAGIEPIFDILDGNPAAASRWAASFSNNLLPLGAFRAELGRNLSDGLRELDMDFLQLMRNRNNYLDFMNVPGALPYKYSWLDGEHINPGGNNFFARAWNSAFPMKVTGEKLSPEAQFLVDIEFDTRPTFLVSSGGADYTPAERSELFSIMGKNKSFLKDVRAIMSQPNAKIFRKRVQAAGRAGKVNYEDFDQLHYQVKAALRRAITEAEAELSTFNDVKMREAQNRYDKSLNEAGLPGTALNLTNK